MQDVEHIRSLGNKPQSAPVWTGSKTDGGTEVEAETARGQEAETEVEQETEQAADAEPDPEGEHMIM